MEILSDGTIGWVKADREVRPNSGEADRAQQSDAQGKLLMPALINCHTHLYSTLARGIALPGRAPRNFPEILKKLWWRLDRALNLDDVYYSALVGLIDSAKCGVGTLVDHHFSPNACTGSLDRIEQAFREVGLRGVLCYETSDRNGSASAVEGIRENIRFSSATRGARATAWWPAALGCTLLSHSVTARCGVPWRRMSHCERVSTCTWRRTTVTLDDARRRYRKSPVRRLGDLGILQGPIARRALRARWRPGYYGSGPAAASTWCITPNRTATTRWGWPGCSRCFAKACW